MRTHVLARPALATLILTTAAGCTPSPPPPAGAAHTASTAAGPASAPTVTTPSSTTSAAAAPAQEVQIEWVAKKRGAGPKVRVGLRVQGQEVDLEEVDATSDGAGSGTPAACVIFDKESTKTSSRFGCGGTPAYHFFTAILSKGALVVTSTRGVEGEAGSEKTREVARVAAAGATLVVAPFPPKAARRAAEQKPCPTGTFAGEGGCIKECATDADCPSPKVCEDVRFIEKDGRIGPLMGRGCQ